MNLAELNKLIAERITPFLFDAKFIQQAVIQDKISDLQQTGKSVSPTYESYNCKLTIDKLIEDITPIVDDLITCTRSIAKSAGHIERFDQIHRNFTNSEENFESPSLEKYIGLRK